METKKRCVGCGRNKKLKLFYPDKKGRLGRRSKCITCYSDEAKTRRGANLEASREYHRKYAVEWRKRNLEVSRARSTANQKRYMRELSTRVKALLGNKCAGCPVTEVILLHVEHKNDDGWADKIAFRGNRAAFLRHVLENPDDYQLMCPNCNHRKRLAGRSEPTTVTAGYTRKYVAKCRQAAFALLGNRCVECPETDYDVLCIDHKGGNGRQDRLHLGGSLALYKDVLVNPHKYQPMCHNCNWLKRHRCQEWHTCEQP